MLWSFEGMLSKATTRVCRGGLDFCSLNIFRHFLWRLLGHHGGGLSWAQCFKKKFIRAGASFKLCRSILETFGEWDNGRGVGVTLTLKRCQFIFLPDRVCLPGKSGKFGGEVAICRDSHRAGRQEAARVWTQAA